jgi:hypothetical protein
MKQYLPECKEWTEVSMNAKLVDIIAKVSGRIFVGPDLCQDPEYLHSASNYTVYLMQALYAIKQTRPWLRPFLVPRLPEIRRLREMEKRAAKHLEPIVRERKESERNDPNWEKPDDMVSLCYPVLKAHTNLSSNVKMQWLLNHSAEHGVDSVEGLAKTQLGLIFAAIHTTTMTVTNILYTLAVMPEYIGPLREEVREVMAENGGKITTRALQQMLKLDSYMKESTRVYPPGLSMDSHT